MTKPLYELERMEIRFALLHLARLHEKAGDHAVNKKVAERFRFLAERMAEQTDALEEAATPKPKACPFCRREEVDVHYDHKYDTYYVRCNTFMCNARGPSAGSRETAINTWNQEG